MSHERLFRIKAELERQQALPDQKRAQTFNAQKGEPIGTQGLMCSSMYEADFLQFWHRHWPTKKVMISQESIVNRSPFNKAMNIVETNYLLARAHVLTTIYTTVNQIRREFGLQEIELATNEDLTNTIAEQPKGEMTVMIADKHQALVLPRATIIEGIPMMKATPTNRFKKRGDNEDGSIGIAPTQFRDLP